MTSSLSSTRLRLAAAAVGAACLLGPAAASAAPADVLHWRSCATAETAPGLQCATMRVPVDWARPHGPRTSIAIDRLPARDQRRRIGPLFFNPGGPGESAVASVAQKQMLPRATMGALRDRFDLIGVDPRGVGRSAPLRCGPGLEGLAVPPIDLSDGAFAAFRRANAAAGRRCRARTGPLLEHVDSATVAQDLDAVRQALGARQISWLGISYGSLLGQEYAARFPERVRATVLDGVLDRAVPIPQVLLQQAQAEGDAFAAFGAWCTKTATCALHGQDVGQVMDRLTAAPAGVPDAKLGRPASGVELTRGVHGGLVFPEEWPQLAAGLAKADGQRGPADASGLVPAAPTFAPITRSVLCADLGGRLGSAAEGRQLLGRVQALTPHTWRYVVMWDVITGCTDWPVPARPAARRISGVSRALVVSTTTDPSTPLPSARSLSRRITGSRLLVFDGVGHTGLQNSSCVQRREARFLVTRVLPPRGTVCRD